MNVAVEPAHSTDRSPAFSTRLSLTSKRSAKSEAKQKFRRAFERLPQRERELAVLLYVKNMTLREVGDILGVSESRVCQIHSQLKRRLREQLGSEDALFSEVA